jgi:hypothetical protein
MMISPESYREAQQEKSYEDLLRIREELLEEVHAYENHTALNSGDYDVDPDPDVIYQMNLLYLGEVCRLLSVKVQERTSSFRVIKDQ